MFLPNSAFRAVWDFLCLGITVYLAVSIPFQAAFLIDNSSGTVSNWFFHDICFIGFFIVDIYFRSYNFAFVQNGTIVTDINMIQKEYFRDGLFIDIISCLPFGILAYWYDINYFFLLRIVHLTRFFRIGAYFVRVESYLALCNIRIGTASSLLVKMFFSMPS